MALLLFGSCWVFVSYAVTIAKDKDKTRLDTAPLPTEFSERDTLKAGWLVARVLLAHRQSTCYNTGRRALGTLNILNSKWTVDMNYIRKISLHFNISWNCQNKWSGFHGHRSAELVPPLFQQLAAVVGAPLAWDITFCSGCLWMVSKSPWERALSHWDGKCVCMSYVR